MRIPIRSGEKLKKTRNKKVCLGRKTSKKVVQSINKTRNRKFFSGESDVEESGRVQDQDRDDNVFPGSLDG